MKKSIALMTFLPILVGAPLLVDANPTIIPGDLVVEGKSELQNDTEVQGDLTVVGPQSELFLGNDGLAAFQSFLYPGTVGMFWDPQQMAFRAGRVEGNQWDLPWALYSAALGYNVRASGTHSVALNQSTTANGGSALSTGKNTMAGGDASVSMGFFTQAQSFASVVLGSYNELQGGNHASWVSSDPLFVIGNGTAWNNRRNALTVLKDGRTGIGTSTPEVTLDVQGDARFDGEVFISHIPPQGDILMGQFGN